MNDDAPAGILGADDVTAWFGYWPNFHDFEILSLQLDREGVSALRIFGFHRTDEVDAEGCYIRTKKAVITFEFQDVFDLELVEFNCQNVMNYLAITRTEEGYRLAVGPCWGMNGYLEAKAISVKISPWGTAPGDVI